MGSGSRMCRTQLWLLIFLFMSSLTAVADGSQLKVMSAPNVLRVGTAENIFVECQDCTNYNDIRVQINVMNHPNKIKMLASTYVTLSSANHFQDFGQIKIPAGDFSKDPNVKQYVYLQAQFPDQLLEKVVLVSFQSGYIFIQTDKALYTPNSNVLYRMFGVTPRMEPVERDNENGGLIVIEIVTPENIKLPLGPVSLNSGLHSGYYRLSENASPGLWKVLARFQSNPQQSFSAEFEVQESVPRSFEVILTPVQSFFIVDSEELIVNIKAKYLMAEEVNGMAYVIFGVIQAGQKISFPSSVQRVPIVSGLGEVKLKREHITQTFSSTLHLVGSSIFVAVSVLTDSGREMVEAELRGIQIVSSPYTIHFKKTSKYFKPGMPFDVAVQVMNPDGTPAHHVIVVVYPGEARAYTSASGMARVTINTETSDRLTITAKTNDPQITSERQASATMVAFPYTTRSKNYIHLDVNGADVELGTNLRINFFINRQQHAQNDITYLIMSRGQLVKHGRLQTKSRMMISLLVPITKEMLPSFRIIAYYHTDDNEVVSDSVWLDVKDSCTGSLKLEPLRYAASYGPGQMFGLRVTGDPEAKVGLVTVDKTNFIINEKYRLTQKKVWDMVERYDTSCTPGGGKDSMSVFYDAGLLFESSASGTPYRTDSSCPAPSRRKRNSATMDSSWVEDDDNSYMDSNEIVSRYKFPDSWLWSEIRLPPCPRQTPNCVTTSYETRVPLAHSVTTWHFTGISLSRTNGICVAKPLEVIVRKEFFIDLRLPYSAVRGEQLEIAAIIHNYSPDQVIVRVDLLEMEHVCSAAYRHGRYRQEVRIGAQTTQSVPFIIIPIKEGQHRIEVKAAVKDSSLHDGISKMLQVVPEGVLLKSTNIITLNPAKQGVDGKQEVIINSQLPLSDVAPNTPVSTQISLTGSEQAGAFVENAINGNSMSRLIYQPVGNGEGNMIHMTLPVIATMYLDKTNQWETVGFDKRDEALKYIKTGYQNELAYRKNDGSFAVFPHHLSSTWLTAYVAKVFSMANTLVALQHSSICDAVKFLIFNAQQPDGVFRENGYVFNSAMRGDVQGRDSDASMTAFCVIAMQESRMICSHIVNSLPGSINKAVTYLEKRLPSLTNPYAVAMASYALANENKLNKEILYKFVSPDLSHWPVSGNPGFTLEATAYALLALVKTEAFEDARPVVRWFNQQQRVAGGYGSTQATIMVYQAVAEYWATAKEQEYDVFVDILLPDRSNPSKFYFNKENYYTTRTLQFNSINRDVKVTAMGNGEVTLKMVSMYYSLPKQSESDCNKFNLSVQLIPENTDQDAKTYKLKIEVLYKDKERDASMSILDIGLLTGFTVNTNDLQLLSRGHDRIIARYEMRTVVSERGSLIIYLDKVSHLQPVEIVFRIHETLRVGVLQPATVSVHEYYESTHCVKFYHPVRTSGRLLKLCRNGECRCAEENCGMQKKGKINTNERSAKVLEVTSTTRTDFVFKVRVEALTNKWSTDIYKVRIMDVIKEGYVFEGELHHFVSFQHCREALDLRIGKTYLVMGVVGDIQKDEQSQLYEIFLGEKTWIEYWPTEAECQTVEHRLTCLGIEELIAQLHIYCLRPHEGSCAVQKKGHISNHVRIAKASEMSPTNKTDFVYKVRVEESVSFDMYRVRILIVIKEGSYDVGPQGELRIFLVTQRCRRASNLIVGKTYLIMGSSEDIKETKRIKLFLYPLTERTWIEYWPTSEECQTTKYRATCVGIKEMVKHIEFECVHNENEKN